MTKVGSNMVGLTAVPVRNPGHIDIQEGNLPDDANLLKTLLDGLISLTADDYQLLERARLLFDALHAGFTKAVHKESP